jgi:hypothetical protein
MSKSPAEKGKELFEKEDAADQVAGKKFNPKLLVEETSKRRKVVDKEEGEVFYYPLRLEDIDDIDKAQSNQDRSRMILFKMLNRAYPDLTLEDVKKFPLVKASRLLELIAKAEGFLLPPKRSIPGLNVTRKRSSSDL